MDRHSDVAYTTLSTYSAYVLCSKSEKLKEIGTGMELEGVRNEGLVLLHEVTVAGCLDLHYSQMSKG